MGSSNKNKLKKSKFELNQLRKKSNTLSLISNKFRKKLIRNRTKAEMQFEEYLKVLRIRCELQKIIYAGTSFYIVDIYLPRYNCVIEIDGSSHKDKEVDDNIRTSNIILSGIKSVYRFTNKEVFNEFVCINKIRKVLGR
jgi:very-short-patch-repair endonuclease